MWTEGWRVAEITDPCVVANVDGTVESVNDAFCARFAVPRSQAIGARDTELVLDLESSDPDPVDREGLLSGRVAPSQELARRGQHPTRVLCFRCSVDGRPSLAYVFPDPVPSRAKNPRQRRFGGIGPQDRPILLADDDRGVRELLTAALRRTGHEVIAASDGITALRELTDPARAEAPIGLLVTDVVMPGMSGYDLAEQATEATPGLDVVFISGYRNHEPPPGAVMLYKPFSLQALLDLVDARLRPDADGT